MLPPRTPSTPPITRTRSETSARPRTPHQILSSYRFPPQPSPLGGTSLLPSLSPEPSTDYNGSLHPNAAPSTPSRVPSPAQSLLLAASSHDAFEATFTAHNVSTSKDLETPKAEMNEDELLAGEVVDIFQRKPKHHRRTPHPALTTSNSAPVPHAGTQMTPGVPDARRPSLISSCDSRSSDPEEDSAWGNWSYRMSPVSLLTHLAKDFSVEGADDDVLPRGRVLEGLMSARRDRSWSPRKESRQSGKEERRDSRDSNATSTESITHDYLADFFDPEYPESGDPFGSPPPTAKPLRRPVQSSALAEPDDRSTGDSLQSSRLLASVVGKHGRGAAQDEGGDEEDSGGEEDWEWDRVLAGVEGEDE
ncbi:hypothetical protein L198_03743 [Cryptococcus wingfieldii CBS 7118]|uniref:Uncharacterized protein n=1 Tax=Cryptococcus wingfieldii CBS 7118 TaxID=1295528 RepID=A0A1E3JC89_9TREE|nr:hypothetical protein L198_03743 [Cryptococcus wingfieldii CBS 7118]ODN98498.1 hypothetical protein L198_03743 [Cryptococcus wingfieldii CBS 7118]